MKCHVTFAAVLMAVSILAHGASFDCKRAASDAEILICKSFSLRELDDELQKRYEIKLGSTEKQNVLRAEQREWLRNIRDRCTSEDCLRRAYRKRIGELEAVIGELHLGNEPGIVQVMAKATIPGCQLSVVSREGKILQSITLKSGCPVPSNFATFDPNSDGYEDFVVIGGYGAGPFPFTEAWLYSSEKKVFELDNNYPGGWPTKDGCTVVESRIGISVGPEPYAYTSEKYCYRGGQWWQ